MFRKKLIAVSLIGIFLISACGGNHADTIPTADLNAVQTHAIETFSAIQTQTAFVTPTIELFPTLTPSPTIQPFTTSAATLPAVSQPTAAATQSCYSMAFVSDVTISDNTPVAPGQTFTKTWKVVNNGSCPWDAGFKFSFTGGDAMGGQTYTFPSSVAVNGIVDISIAMTAPTNKTGTVRSNWRMSTTAGQFFGDEVYVIVVVGTATSTPTQAATSYP